MAKLSPAATNAKRFVAYYRVSTAQQGASGLGLEAQREAVARHVAAAQGVLVAEFTEIESGKKNDRPQLMKKILPALAIVALLTGCEHAAGDLGVCYDGAFTSFCKADLPNGQAAVVPGTGMVPAIGSALGGIGMLMLGQGTILNGAVAAVHAP